jgi:phosphorylcholine metabolism protein LicD
MKTVIRDFLYDIGLFLPIKKFILLYKRPMVKYKAQKMAKPVICKLGKIFEQACEEYWLDYGTLLGYVREGKIIKGDDDLDFGVIVKKGVDLSELLAQKDIHIYKRLIVEGDIAFEQYRYKDFKFDIFYYRREDGEFVTNLWVPYNYDIPQHASYKKGLSTLSEVNFSSFETKKIHFYDCPFRVPEDSGTYLAQNYGKDYMIPNSDWGYADELNSRAVSKEHIVEFFE